MPGEEAPQSPDGDLTGPWKLFLLGDGSPTRHLQLLTGAPVEVEVVGMVPEPSIDPMAPMEVAELDPPLLRRQVWLRCGGQPLGWAESWWNQAEAEAHLRDRGQPIWRSLTAGRAELFREVDGLARVEASWLGQGFAARGPFWSRHYRFFRQRASDHGDSRGVCTGPGAMAGAGPGGGITAAVPQSGPQQNSRLNKSSSSFRRFCPGLVLTDCTSLWLRQHVVNLNPRTRWLPPGASTPASTPIPAATPRNGSASPSWAGSMASPPLHTGKLLCRRRSALDRW